ncbi:MAG: NUDIX domain-containing protein [Chloroflexota bacterium]
MSLPEIADYPDRYQFRFCPLCATPLEQCTHHGRTRLVCPDDGWTFFPNPNIAATVVVEYQGGIVLLRRAIPPDQGIWHLPIGHLEFGESPEQAALREASEETGLILEDPVFLDFEHSPSYGDAAMFYIVFCYRARATGGELQVDHENSDIRVASFDDIPELKWSSQRRALAVWQKWRATYH